MDKPIAIIDPEVVNDGSVELGPVPILPRHDIDLHTLGFGGSSTLAYSRAAHTGGNGKGRTE